MSAPKRFSDLQKIEGHKNYYRSFKSGIIYYKDSQLGKFSTGETSIMKAKKVVELRKLHGSGVSAERSRAIANGVTSPLLSIFWTELMEIKAQESSENTMKTYDVNWRHTIAPFWGEKTVSDLTDSNIQKYKEWYLKNHAKRYAEKTVVHFGMLIRWMQKKGHLKKAPDLGILKNLDEVVAKNTQRKKPGRVYTDHELEQMFAAAQTISDQEYMNARAYLGILLGGCCGLRKESEALALKWENVDLKNCVMNVWSMKNHKWREVPFTQRVKDAFLKQREFTGHTPFVFPMQTDPTKPISSQLFDKLWVAVKEEINLKGREQKGNARFHDLRHTFASKTANDGWPPKVACSILDMSLDEYDRTYAKASIERKTELMNRTFGAKPEVKKKEGKKMRKKVLL